MRGKTRENINVIVLHSENVFHRKYVLTFVGKLESV